MNSPKHAPEYLWRRLHQVGIPSWRAWQQQAGVSRRVIGKARQNQWSDLKWGEIQRLAATLGWDPESLLAAHTPSPQAALTAEIQQLRTALQDSQDQARRAAHRATFEQLQSLLTSFPTAKAMALGDPSRPAHSLVALFKPLETWLHHQGITPIGIPFQKLPYDPVEHHCEPGGIPVGDPVEVRLVGYRQGADILVPARVTPLGLTVKG